MDIQDKVLNCAKFLKKYFTAFGAPYNVYKDFKRNMGEYKDKYKGERCFIVGNGPSLLVDDLDLIKNEYSFAANKIYKIFDKTDWRPTFYCVQDIDFAVSMGEEMKVSLASAKHSFFRMRSYKSTNQITRQYDNLTYVPIVEPVYNTGKINFSKIADKHIYDGWTVTYMALQIAVHMGFENIYLIGVDHSFPFEKRSDGKVYVIDKNKAAHFYETANDNQGDSASKHRSNFHELVTLGYEAAESYSRKTKKFRIFNATRGGELEVFERVSVEEILNVSK